MDADEFITLSGKLVALGGAAGLRSAVSRAYYGVYHIAKDILADVGCSPGGAGRSHNDIPIFLGCSTNPDARKAASLIGDLHEERLKADYQLGNSSVEALAYAKICVETAAVARQCLQQFKVALQAEDAQQQLREKVQEIKKVR